MVIIGSARIDENGEAAGGRAGDQTGKEVSTQKWYDHPKGWRVFRCKDVKKRELIARNMQYACDNDNIGYDQSQNTTLYKIAEPLGFDCSRVTTKCETDCARLVRVCLAYAGIKTWDFYTGDMVQALKDTYMFDEYPLAAHDPDKLLRGDILVTRTTGHTVIVLSNSKQYKTEPPSDNYDGVYLTTN